MIRIIAGRFKGKAIDVPKKGTRPTLGALREALFNICQQQIVDATFLDLFAGGGSIGIEALSRGAKHVTFVEKNRLSCKIIENNLQALGATQEGSIVALDVFKALPHLKHPFSIIFADPPYELGLGDRLLEYFDNDPTLLGGDLFLEESKITYAPKNLSVVSKRKVGRSTLLQLRKRDLFSRES